MQATYNYPGGQYLYPCSSGIKSTNHSIRGLINYPIVVHVSKIAAEKLTQLKRENKDIDLRISCLLSSGRDIELITITNNFFRKIIMQGNKLCRGEDYLRQGVGELQVFDNCFCNNMDADRAHSHENMSITSTEAVTTFNARLRLGQLAKEPILQVTPAEVIPKMQIPFQNNKHKDCHDALTIAIHFDPVGEWVLNLYQKEYDITSELKFNDLYINEKAPAPVEYNRSEYLKHQSQ